MTSLHIITVCIDRPTTRRETNRSPPRKRRGIHLIVPHLSNRVNRYQDGRALRRYRRRWIIERTNAWLHNFRRLVTRYDHKLEHYRAFLHAACMLINLRQF